MTEYRCEIESVSLVCLSDLRLVSQRKSTMLVYVSVPNVGARVVGPARVRR